MSAVGTLPSPVGARVRTAWLVALLVSAVALRSGIGPRTTPGGLAMAAVLLAGAVTSSRADGTPPAARRRLAEPVLWGIGGAALLVCGPLLAWHPGPSPTGAFAPWAVAVTIVVVAEEAFLRGALWRACARRTGGAGALVVTTAAFAGMHVPVYGWRAVPLDLVVGALLGGLRLGSGSVVAPTVAHLAADWAGWWLV